MPIVTIQQSPREVEQKRRLVAGITRAFAEAYGTEQVQIFIHEVEDENWGRRGVLAIDGEAPRP